MRFCVLKDSPAKSPLILATFVTVKLFQRIISEDPEYRIAFTESHIDANPTGKWGAILINMDRRWGRIKEIGPLSLLNTPELPKQR